jgi:lysophospholipase L1-like esterase
MKFNKHPDNLKRGLLLGLVVLLQGCGGGEASPLAPADTPLAPQVVPGNWVVMGSSSAFGAGASDGQSWAAQLQSSWQSSAVELKNLAKPGSVTYEGLPSSAGAAQERPLPDTVHNVDAALALKPRLLLVSYPSNDTALGFSVDETVRNVLAIRAMARSQQVPVMVLSTQPRQLSPELLQRMQQIDMALMQEVQDCFVPVHADLAGANGLLALAFDSGDGVHPNNAGHTVIFRKIQGVLNAGRCVSAGG